MFDEEVEWITAEGDTVTGRADLADHFAEMILDVQEKRIMNVSVGYADQPHLQVQLAVCRVSFVKNGEPITEEHRVKFGPCPDWRVEKWERFVLEEEEAQDKSIRELTEDDMDFMDIPEAKRGLLRLSPKEYVERILEPYKDKYNDDGTLKIKEPPKTELDLAKEELEGAKKEVLVEWLAEIGLAELEPMFVSRDYCDVAVLKEMGMDDEDFDFLKITDLSLIHISEPTRPY
eukprot:TRINITY_DN51146_c0_g1_i1.p1 TRINITY_DN51146_c0_g1~~TRINITY_DN51146_c0_g1_i1.p1  ORF type:complete len:232 (-),score=79.03 TRINITY_DN51146_c0_g1_i1:16-711(-)